MTDPLDDDEIPNAGYAEPSIDQLKLDWPGLMELLNASASRTVFVHVSNLLDTVRLEDSEIEALLKMPVQYRQTVAAHLLDCAETIREGSRDLDSQLMRLTGELV